MKKDSFSDAEIEEINIHTKDWDINDKKSFIQTLIVNRSLKDNNKNICLCLFTGFGKTTTSLIYTDRYKSKYPDSIMRVVVPTNNLKRDWYKKREYYFVHVINSFTMTMTEENKKCNFLIVDEVHHGLGQESKHFNTVLDIQCDYKLVLSASLTDKNITKLEEKGFDYVFTLSVETGSKLGIVPNVKIINIPVVFSPTEKMRYHANEQELQSNSKIFSSVIMSYSGSKEYILRRLCINLLKKKSESFIFNGLDINSEELAENIFKRITASKVTIRDKATVVGMAKKINYNFITRDKMIDNCADKISAVNSLLSIITKKKGELKNVLIFSKSIDFIELLSARLNSQRIKSAVIHSKLPPDKINKIIQLLKDEYYKVLLSIGIIKEGFDLESCDTIIRTAYNGTVLDAEQIIGRALRYDKNNLDKQSVVFNLYVDTFTYREKTYDSIEAEKLEYAYAKYEMDWVDNIDNLEQHD